MFPKQMNCEWGGHMQKKPTQQHNPYVLCVIQSSKLLSRAASLPHMLPVLLWLIMASMAAVTYRLLHLPDSISVRRSLPSPCSLSGGKSLLERSVSLPPALPSRAASRLEVALSARETDALPASPLWSASERERDMYYCPCEWKWGTRTLTAVVLTVWIREEGGHVMCVMWSVLV